MKIFLVIVELDFLWVMIKMFFFCFFELRCLLWKFVYFWIFVFFWKLCFLWGFECIFLYKCVVRNMVEIMVIMIVKICKGICGLYECSVIFKEFYVLWKKKKICKKYEFYWNFKRFNCFVMFGEILWFYLNKFKVFLYFLFNVFWFEFRWFFLC